MVGIKEIAKIATVSPATVSLVLNKRPGISEATIKKVMDAVQKTGYVRNGKKPMQEKHGSIRFLKYKKHGLAIDDNGFIHYVIDGADARARSLGYEIVITTFNHANRDEIISLVNQDTRDGLLLLGTEMTCDDFGFLSDLRAPIVVIDSYFEFEDHDCVVMNNVDATYKAVDYLHRLNHRQIGHLKSSVVINNFTERDEGYHKALKKLEIPYAPEFTFCVESTLEGAYRDMKAILEYQPSLPTAIFSDCDTMAIGAMKAFREHGVQIPKQLSIIGFDDIPYCNMTDPPLTTMRILKEEIGRLSVERLVSKIRDNDSTIIKQQVGAQLIVRNSTKAYGED